MTRRRARGVERLLRCYPASWRERYGDELAALVEDMRADGQPMPRIALSVAVAGIRERVTQVLAPSPAGPQLSGVLLVLSAWTMLVIAGISFAKRSEHVGSALHGRPESVTAASYGLVEVTALLAAAAVVGGVLLALPAAVRLIRTSGSVAGRSRLQWTLGATVVAAVAFGWLVFHARSLSTEQRNGGDAAYSVEFAVVAVSVVVALSAWTSVAVALGRRLHLSLQVVRIEQRLATVTSAAIVVTSLAVAAWWWGAWSGHATGDSSVAADDGVLVATMVLLLAACAVAWCGLLAIHRSRAVASHV